MHVDYKGMVDLGKDVTFVLNWFFRFFVYDFSFGYLFEGVCLVFVFHLNFEYFTEATTTNNVLDVEEWKREFGLDYEEVDEGCWGVEDGFGNCLSFFGGNLVGVFIVALDLLGLIMLVLVDEGLFPILNCWI